MRRLVLSCLALIAVLAIASPALAGVYYYSSNDGIGDHDDIMDLDHYKAYTWGINWNHPGEVITDAYLRFSNIYNWAPEKNDSLYLRLLDTAPLGLRTYTDNQAVGDYFASTGDRIAVWSDPDDNASSQNLSYSFSALGLVDKLNTYAMNDNRFGISFDPDCHYFNTGVKLIVTTAPVPEPATMALLGLGLLGTGIVRRRRK